MNKLKILHWDIETSLQLVTVFQLANNDWIDPSNIVQERYVICASWLWEGDDKVHSISVLDNPKLYAKDPYNDKYVLEVLHKVLSEADVIVHHNGDSFDKKYVDTRMLVQGFSPLPPVISIDTYKTAKSRFMLNSNKLDYIGGLLKVGRKKPTTAGLWMRILKGDRKAIREMIDYNKEDVRLLQRVFHKLAPYMPNHVNRELFGGTGCPRCGSHKIQSRGTHVAITNTYQRFQCQAPKCMGWFKLAVAIKGKKSKYRVL